MGDLMAQVPQRLDRPRPRPTDEARYHLQAGLKLWHDEFRSYTTYRALAKITLAEIAYETDSLDEARIKLGEEIYTAEHIDGRGRTVVKALIRRAIIAYQESGEELAIVHMLHALELAEPLGYDLNPGSHYNQRVTRLL